MVARFFLLFAALAVFCASAGGQDASANAQTCIDCHSKKTPNIVSDWKLSRHSQLGVTCVACHGDQHNSDADVSKVRIPPPKPAASATRPRSPSTAKASTPPLGRP